MHVTRIFRFTDKLFLEYRWSDDWVANLGETSTHGTFLINLICRLTIFFNLKTSRSDWHVSSPYNIHTLSSMPVMRMLKLVW